MDFRRLARTSRVTLFGVVGALTFLLVSTELPAKEGGGSDSAAGPVTDSDGSDAPGGTDAGSGDAPGSGSQRSSGVRPSVPSTEARPPAPPLFAETPARGVLVVEIDGEITPGMAAFVTRAVEEARAAFEGTVPGSRIDVLVVRVDTFGGRVDSAVQIRDALLDAPVPVVVFVQNRAISAGALITYAADHIVFSPAASMGAATPIQLQGGEAVPVDEKVVSYMRAEMRATASANGRRADLAEAMVDRVVVVPDVVDGETLLTVTTSEAVALEIADGVAENLDALLTQIGAQDAPQRQLERNWAEKLAIFITNPAVAGLLMSLGILGIWVEIKTPGFGAPGLIGILALAAFFFGHMVVHLAGWEEVILLLVGLALLIVEIFLVPGFGVPGVLGIACLVGSFVLAMVGLPVGVSWEIGFVNLAAFRVFVSLLAVVIVMFLLGRYLPEQALPGWLVLRTTIAAESGARSADTADAADALVGRRGVATTDLRPSGRARVDGRVLDVVSRTDWVDRGAQVQVVEVAGVRILVDLVEPPVREPSASSSAPVETTPGAAADSAGTPTAEPGDPPPSS